jgi:hypothetical protein
VVAAGDVQNDTLEAVFDQLAHSYYPSRVRCRGVEGEGADPVQEVPVLQRRHDNVRHDFARADWEAGYG